MALPNPQSPQPTLADSPATAIALQKATEATAIPANAPTIAQRIPFTSDVLISSSTNATLLDGLKGVNFSAFDKISPADLAVRKAKARRAALTLAAQQTSPRRQ